MKKRNTYSAIVLILVIIAEVLIMAGIRFQILDLIVWPSIVIVPIVLLGIFAWLYANHVFLPHSTVFTNLMANAILPSWWGAFYLLFFIVHIGWISDGTLNLFTADNDNYNEVIVSIIAGFVGMFILICFFPEAKTNKDKPLKKVFVSGISSFPTSPNPYTGKPTAYKEFNLRPLVRILQLELDRLEDCEFLILKTDMYNMDVPPICIANADTLRLNVYEDEDFMKYGVKKELKADGSLSVDCKLRLIIKKIAWKEFIEDVKDDIERKKKEDWIKNHITIHFTLPCDYNDFIMCFKTLNSTMQDFDTKDRQFYMNLTPGTVVISSIITLLSIDSGRELYYYRQGKGIEDIDRLNPVDKKNVPLANLLSQALETIKK